MKVVHIINSDIRGGAPRAALGICRALRENGVDSQMLVQRKFGSDSFVYSVSEGFLDRQLTNLRMLADIIQMDLLTKKANGRFSFASVGMDISESRIIQQADILHLHWINEGFLSLSSLKKLSDLGKPVVWTLHDMWAFTGGCHYSSGCTRFKNTCNNCPYLKYPSDEDSSTRRQNEKLKVYQALSPHIVTCSRWLAGEAYSSKLMNSLKVSVVPNAIDTCVYKPCSSEEARQKLGLPKDKILILFTALNTNEERKGFKELKATLRILIDRFPLIKNTAELLVLGTSSPEELSDLPISVNPLGRIYGDERIAECYNAADVFVAPSLEDNLPNTVMEALSCGIPAAAFNIGGMPDMIEHKLNGYLAAPYSAEDLAAGIHFLVEDKVRMQEFRNSARKKVLENFTPSKVALRYTEIYNSQLNKT